VPWPRVCQPVKRSTQTIVARYILLCAIAMVTNLGMQAALSLVLVHEGVEERVRLLLALSGGTMAGLVIKYILDKRYIFFDHSRGLSSHAKKFSIYTAMGLITTAIFWISEAIVFLIIPTTTGLLIGGGIGLSIGYVIKYHLDRRFVFEVAA
jgi:putative flippase GtrA